ncbi:TonB-dependent receptor [Lacinutrix salivirga]
MKQFCVVFLFVSVIVNLHAQQLKVINSTTNEPIPGVAIFNKNKDKSEITDFDGLVNLNVFSENETLIFQHLSYKRKVKKKALLAKVLKLERTAQGLEEIVISASKFKENKNDIPRKIVSLNAKNITFSNPQTSADLLENTGQVFIQKSQLSGGSPMIRGFSTNRLLITIDGVRMNNAIFRGGNLQNVISIDPFSVSKTEVILGAGSVIYGSDAIGGVMSFYTKTPQFSKTDSLITNTSLVGRYATASNENTGHISLNLGLKKWAFLTQASYTSFDDLRMGTHGPEAYLRPEFVNTVNGQDQVVNNNNPKIQRHTGYNQLNLMQKASYKAAENLDLNLGVYYTTTSDNPRYDRLTRYRDNTLRSAEWYYGPQRWFMVNFGATKLSSNSNLYDKIKTNIAFQNFNESRIDRDFQDVERSIKKEQVNAYSFNLDFEKDLNTKTKLFYGLEYVFNSVFSKAKIENIETGQTEKTVTRYPNNSQWQSAALYASLKYKPNPKFVFQSGLRYNNVSYKADFTENNTFLNLPFQSAKSNSGALTGTAGFNWIPNNKIQWRLNLSSAFRAPNIDDIGKVFDSEPGSVVVPNQNLKPEYAYGGELGLRLKVSKALTLDMATYYTYLDNALVRKDGNINGETEIFYAGELSNVQSIQNASKEWIYGFEIGAELQLSNYFKLTSQYNILGGTEEKNNIEVPVRHVSPNFGSTHFVWDKNAFKLDLFANYNNELAFNQLAESERGKDYIYALDKNGNPYSPSWYTLNLRTQVQISDAMLLTTSLENITDQRYKTYSSGIAAPGRNLIVSLKYSL